MLPTCKSKFSIQPSFLRGHEERVHSLAGEGSKVRGSGSVSLSSEILALLTRTRFWSERRAREWQKSGAPSLPAVCPSATRDGQSLAVGQPRAPRVTLALRSGGAAPDEGLSLRSAPAEVSVALPTNQDPTGVAGPSSEEVETWKGEQPEALRPMSPLRRPHPFPPTLGPVVGPLPRSHTHLEVIQG